MPKETQFVDAIDELCARSKDCRDLRDFHALHRSHPELLDFLTEEIELRLSNQFSAFSFHSLWHYARWKLDMQRGMNDTFLLNDHASPLYARAIVILHPHINGRAEFRNSKANDIFGLEFAPLTESQPGDYARRLQWIGGTPIESGWRPTIPHVPHLQLARKPDIHDHFEREFKKSA